jgi:hypothetical protein
LTAAATSFFRHLARLKWARESVARVQTLAQAHRYFEAYDLAVAVRKYLPNEPAFTQLMGTISDDLSVSTDPPGARAAASITLEQGMTLTQVRSHSGTKARSFSSLFRR